MASEVPQQDHEGVKQDEGSATSPESSASLCPFESSPPRETLYILESTIAKCDWMNFKIFDMLQVYYEKPNLDSIIAVMQEYDKIREEDVKRRDFFVDIEVIPFAVSFLIFADPKHPQTLRRFLQVIQPEITDTEFNSIHQLFTVTHSFCNWIKWKSKDLIYCIYSQELNYYDIIRNELGESDCDFFDCIIYLGNGRFIPREPLLKWFYPIKSKASQWNVKDVPVFLFFNEGSFQELHDDSLENLYTIASLFYFTTPDSLKSTMNPFTTRVYRLRSDEKFMKSIIDEAMNWAYYKIYDYAW